MKRILIIDSYYGGSHKYWIDNLKQRLPYQIDLLTLPVHNWKLRMQTSGLILAKQYIQRDKEYDLIIFTDILNIPQFLVMANIPSHTKTVLYFHENQFAYPKSLQDTDIIEKRDEHYCFINLQSALAVDEVLFNSQYNKESFINGAMNLLKRLQIKELKSDIDNISKTAKVLPQGIEYAKIQSIKVSKSVTPRILWNHRWEYDKGLMEFISFSQKLQEEGMQFELLMLGKGREKFLDRNPKILDSLKNHIVIDDHIEDKEEYFAKIKSSHLLPVFSKHDFFGVSVVEAIAAGVHPLLPNRLAYPEHISPQNFPGCYYNSESELLQKTKDLFHTNKFSSSTSENMSKYDWESNVIPSYQVFIDCLTN